MSKKAHTDVPNCLSQALFLVRMSLTGLRLYLDAGSREATRHYAAMEV